MRNHDQNTTQRKRTQFDPDQTETWVDFEGAEAWDHKQASEPIEHRPVPEPKLPSPPYPRPDWKLDGGDVLTGLVTTFIAGTLCWLWTEGMVTPDRPREILRWIPDHIFDLTLVGAPLAVVGGIIRASLRK